MNNIAFDRFDDGKSSGDNRFLVWIFRKYSRRMLEYHVELYFDAQLQEWTAYRTAVRDIKAKWLTADSFIAKLPEEERARALAAAITWRDDS